MYSGLSSPNLAVSNDISEAGSLVPDAKISAAFPGANLGRKKSTFMAAKNTTSAKTTFLLI